MGMAIRLIKMVVSIVVSATETGTEQIMSQNKWDKKRGIWQPRISEEMVLKEIVDRLWFQARIKMFRIRERIPGKGRLSTPGLPDLIGWIPAEVASIILIEVKRPGGVRRPAQTRFIDEARGDGCLAFFAESWADVCREFKVVGYDLKEDGL